MTIAPARPKLEVMIRKILAQAQGLFAQRHKEINSEQVRSARDYIVGYWAKLERYHPKDDETLLGLPKPYLVPAYEEGHEFDFNELYYWDSYFMVQGMLDAQHKDLVMGILEDLLFLQKRFGIIPNASRTYLMGRSHPPFLTSFIFDVYDTYDLDKKWLKKAMESAKDEYKTVWMGKTKPNARLVYQGLSRNYDINYIHDLAEAESGWDMTPRFGRKCLNYLPVDLNSLLYKYEMDFSRAAKILGKRKEAEDWEALAKKRKKTMNGLMWNKIKGLFYDYNFVKERRGNVSSLASYFTMWAGLATEKQAKQMVKNLKRFEQPGGLATTDQQFPSLVAGGVPTQWAWPNGWAPLHLIVIEGLKRYGYHADAKRIANKWLKNNLDWYNKNGVFIEKYNVVNPEKPPAKGLYPSQTGFGWTNAVFERLCRDYVDK